MTGSPRVRLSVGLFRRSVSESTHTCMSASGSDRGDGVGHVLSSRQCECIILVSVDPLAVRHVRNEKQEHVNDGAVKAIAG